MIRFAEKVQVVHKRFEHWFNARFAWFFTNGNKPNPYTSTEEGSLN